MSSLRLRDCTLYIVHNVKYRQSTYRNRYFFNHGPKMVYSHESVPLIKISDLCCHCWSSFHCSSFLPGTAPRFCLCRLALSESASPTWKNQLVFWIHRRFIFFIYLLPLRFLQPERGEASCPGVESETRKKCVFFMFLLPCYLYPKEDAIAILLSAGVEG